MTRLGQLSEHLQGKRGKALVASLASAALVAAGAVAFQVADSSGDSDQKADPATPRNTTVRTVALPAPEAGSASVHSRQERTEPFSLIGVTWDDAAKLVDGRVQVRAHNTDNDQWTAWSNLSSEKGAEGASAARRGGTEPIWVGASDGVEVRVDGSTVNSLPAGLRLDLIDPDHESTTDTRAAGSAGVSAPRWELAAQRMDEVAPTDPIPSATQPTAVPETSVPGEAPQDTPSADPVPTSVAPVPDAPAPTTPAAQDPATTSTPVPTATGRTNFTPTATQTPTPTATERPTTVLPTSVTRPAITARSGWQANEKLREQTEPDYTPTAPKIVFVHHTATTSDYSCTDSAKIVRSLYSYHVSSLGWRDLGYNFLVDRCGTIFEGRYGGIDQGVIGAHTYGFNTGSTGISVIGTYSASPAPLAARQAVAHLAAWKLGLAGARSNQSSQLTQKASDSLNFVKGKAYTFNAISGHRDGYATECPGQAFYDKLPEMRTWATLPQNVKVTGVVGANNANNTYYARGTVKLSWSTSTPARLLRSFQVILDGKNATNLSNLTNTTTSASLPLTAGRHTVQIRATHLTGLTAVSPTTTIAVDTTAPRFTSWPAVALRAAQVSSTAVPVTVTWKATDNLALASVKATSPTAATFGPAVTSWATSLRPGGARKITLQPVDRAGNAAAAATATRTVTLTSEQKGTKVGTWSQTAGNSYLGSAALASSRKGASLTWTVTGRSVGLVALRSARSGSATVYVDGAKATTINLYSTTTQYRQMVWTKSLTTGKHTVKIVVAGTSGHPNIYADGLVVQQ